MSDVDHQHAAVTLAGLWIYPVKSCAGVPLVQSMLTPRGLPGDREWVVIGDDDALLWQGELPRMALVRPGLTASRLTLSADGAGSIDTTRWDDGEACTVKIWNEGKKDFDSFGGTRCSDEADRWLSDFLGRRLRLVRLGERALERASLNPLHVVSRASLDRLADALPRDGASACAVERFRPNLLVVPSDGHDAAFEEEQWAALRLGKAGEQVELRFTEPCVRCVMPNVDPVTASVGEEPLATVTQQSALRAPGQPVRFGMYARAAAGAHLAVGMSGFAEIRF